MKRRILVLGATGVLGRAVAERMTQLGHHVRVLARDVEKARRKLPPLDIIEGDTTDRDAVANAISGCDAVHISLPHHVELAAVQHVLDLARGERIERISYVSATTAFEQNRWFKLIDVKLRAETALAASAIPHVVFCPTWAMEVLPNFVKGNRGVVIHGRRPASLHFFATADFGRMVAASYDDDRALGKRLFVHGPEAFTLQEALAYYFASRLAELKVMHLNLWQARVLAWIRREQSLRDVTDLIAYFDRVRELGDPSEANKLFGPPSITLASWVEREGSLMGSGISEMAVA